MSENKPRDPYTKLLDGMITHLNCENPRDRVTAWVLGIGVAVLIGGVSLGLYRKSESIFMLGFSPLPVMIGATFWHKNETTRREAIISEIYKLLPQDKISTMSRDDLAKNFGEVHKIYLTLVESAMTELKFPNHLIECTIEVMMKTDFCAKVGGETQASGLLFSIITDVNIDYREPVSSEILNPKISALIKLLHLEG